jgi:DNA-binding NarL/FixJ family response regulator
MRILIAEDQIPIVDVLERLVHEVYPHSDIDNEQTIKGALSMFHANQYDLVISDLDFKVGKSYALVSAAKSNNVACIIYTLFHNPTFTDKAIELGVTAYVCKRGPLDHIKKAIVNYKNLNRELCKTTQELQKTTKVVLPEKIILKIQEQQIVECLIEGKSYNEIAQTMGLKYNTVKTYIRDLIKTHNKTMQQIIDSYLLWYHRD